MPGVGTVRGAMAHRPPKLLIDVSRTVSRARLAQPTGIDRVERAYIAWGQGQDALYLCRFDGTQYLLSGETVARLLSWLERTGPTPPFDLTAILRPTRETPLRRAQSLVRTEALSQARRPAVLIARLRKIAPEGGVYLNVGHDNLGGSDFDAIRSAGFGAVAMVHDTIPLDYPQYCRASTAEKFREKLSTIAKADLILANSSDTAQALARHIPGARTRVHAVPLGIEMPSADAPVGPKTNSRAEFTVLGTIEPRKNHQLLLELWAAMSAEMAEATPILHIIGRRGWENRAVFDMLDSHQIIGRTVLEHGPLSDVEIRCLLARSRALLMPSFAEGYGLPLAEALAAGCPVIASDLPALREVGAEVPEYLCPTDAARWFRVILDYTAQGSVFRDAQIDRMRRWSPPTWQTHFGQVENLLETILVHEASAG